MVSSHTGEQQRARELTEQCLTLAQSVQDSTLLLASYAMLAVNLFHLGELVPAQEHFEQGMAHCAPQQHRSHALLYGLDPGVVCLSFAAWALWHLGYPDQALKRSQEALTLAQEIAHPVHLGFAHFFAAALHQCRREAQATQERAEAVITLATVTDQEFTNFLAQGTVLRGWALAAQGQGKEGLAQIRQGLTAHQATGAKVGQPHFLALLAEAYGKTDQVETGLSMLAEALTTVDKTGERVDEAELYRLKGELTLQQAKVQGPKSKVEKEAEECFLKAIAIAHRQQAKSWELRATISLSRLWQKQGKRKEARQMLAEIYEWFTEGFDTKDLQEAKALLKELS